jgi:hypothetical protein
MKIFCRIVHTLNGFIFAVGVQYRFVLDRLKRTSMTEGCPVVGKMIASYKFYLLASMSMQWQERTFLGPTLQYGQLCRLTKN